jgi:2-polyprenyl-6-methoxyphenol hydroxylase-like FAD-dependent oxidoreductase
MQILGQGVRAGMYPMSASEVYWFVAFDDDGSHATTTPDESKAHARSMVQGWQHGILACIDGTMSSKISRSRFYDRWPSPLGGLSRGNVTLAGDALHPMTPNLGQV